jgi:hypothetical protein
VPIIAVHLGIVDEEQINHMSYVFFSKVLEQLGHKLQYDAAVNLLGNAFAKDAGDYIQDNNPLFIASGGVKQAGLQKFADFFATAQIEEVGRGEYHGIGKD